MMLRCVTCGQRQRDRRSYRDHLLWAHHEVARRGVDTPTRLEGRELEAVWAGIRRRQETGMALAARRREQLGLPRVSHREAARRLQDNPARSAHRFRAAARARGAATAALGTPVIYRAPQPTVTPLMRTRLGSFQAPPLAMPAGTVRLGGGKTTTPSLHTVPHMPLPNYQKFFGGSTTDLTSSSPPYIAHTSPVSSTSTHPQRQAGPVARPPSTVERGGHRTETGGGDDMGRHPSVL